MLAFRFANGLFEPLWNRNYIDHVQITAAEDLGIGTPRRLLRQRRARCATSCRTTCSSCCACSCMEPPVTFSADEVRDEKVKVLHAITPPTVEEVAEMAVRAQYAAGTVGGEECPATSRRRASRRTRTTETYAALRLEVDNWRWAGVPFYLRTGKRLARKVTEIAVTLKPVPHLAFQQEGSVGVQPNQLVLTVQPNEGVSLSLGGEDPRHADARSAR